jgi:glycosyltransferase involved in cell wall biosynthesis
MPELTGGGSPMRAASHLRVLSRSFNVTLVIVNDGNEAEVDKRLASDLRRACASVVVISRASLINRILQRTRSPWVRMLLEALWPTPLEFAPYRPALAELGGRLAGECFDVVHCFRLNTGLLRLLGRNGLTFGRSVLDLDDYESQTGFRSSAAFGYLVGNKLSILNWLAAVKWYALESFMIPSFDVALVCSEVDRRKLAHRFPGIRWHVVPNTIEEPSKFHSVSTSEFTFLFVGRFDYLPNVDAVVFFCTRVLPIIRQHAPREFRVLIVGRAGHDLNMLSTIEEVTLVLGPPTLAPYYAQTNAVIVPLRSGGGTRLKILEAFSYGLPVISTTVGAEGLDVTSEADIMIADGAAAFAEQCLRIWRDEPLRRRIAAAGHDLWRNKYNPAALVRALVVAYGENSGTSLPEPQ